MATIVARKGKRGTVYRAQVRFMRAGERAYSESKTFKTEAAAESWGLKRDAELARIAADAPVRPITKDSEIVPTLARGIDKYIEAFASSARWGRTKNATIKALQGMPIGKLTVDQIDAGAVLEHVKWRRANGAGPSTALNDVIFIGVVLRAGKIGWQWECKPDEIANARSLLLKTRLVAKSNKRDRRPTYEELKKLDDHFRQRDERSKVPMRYLMWLAIYTGRRLEEFKRIELETLDRKQMTMMMTDIKHPTRKWGNKKKFKLTQQALDLIDTIREGRETGLLFSINHRSVSAAFTRACAILGIEDLHFHDLRHEATSRLFEDGLMIQEVATYTLHDSWAALKVYANIMERHERFDPSDLITPRSPASTP